VWQNKSGCYGPKFENLCTVSRHRNQAKAGDLVLKNSASIRISRLSASRLSCSPARTMYPTSSGFHLQYRSPLLQLAEFGQLSAQRRKTCSMDNVTYWTDRLTAILVSQRPLASSAAGNFPAKMGLTGNPRSGPWHHQIWLHRPDANPSGLFLFNNVICDWPQWPMAFLLP
jgi:hypothetical protein